MSGEWDREKNRKEVLLDAGIYLVGCDTFYIWLFNAFRRLIRKLTAAVYMALIQTDRHGARLPLPENGAPYIDMELQNDNPNPRTEPRLRG